MTYHVGSWYNTARHLCIDHDGNSAAVKAGLIGAGCKDASKVMHQMRIEGRVSADAEQSRSLRYVQNAKASVAHLIDLKRAGHSPRFTELRIPPDSDLPAASLRTRRFNQAFSYCGSPGALCAESGQ